MSDANLAEQAEELEVLASIYPEEFKSLGDGQFKILLKPNPDGNDNHGTLSCHFHNVRYRINVLIHIHMYLLHLFSVFALQSLFPWFAKFRPRIRPTRLPVSR